MKKASQSFFRLKSRDSLIYLEERTRPSQHSNRLRGHTFVTSPEAFGWIAGTTMAEVIPEGSVSRLQAPPLC